MFRDPLYRPIRRKLRELKDGNAFELCANDLLRPFHPGIAPREGGDDAGLDGLIANEDNSSDQLICTTGEDVLGNLSRSIEANLKSGGKSRYCILATSQKLTNAKKRALEDRAGTLGRPLKQIYDQAAMAQLLYRDAHWRKELLGLTGDPPPLSLFPITTRPLFDGPPVGRDDEIAKITKLAEDIVLIGQPGSGKTHVLFYAAKTAKGRFVVDEDIAVIADGIRSLQPRFLIIDDAFTRLDFLKRLKLLREQIGGDFRILASCWPGQEDALCRALQVARAKCHTLEGLPQKQIKQVIQSQKIFGPDDLIAEIIHQSHGKPGLAVTLCRLCWDSDSSRDVMLGTALARDVKLSFEPLLGQAATNLLACFSIGGDAGMPLESVAGLVGKDVLEVRRIFEQLSAAGVLDISSGDQISVHPARLRQALVRDVFLKPPAPNLTPYLSEAPDFAATTRVLIEAKLMGGTLSDEILRQRLEQLADTGEQSAFEEYARLGREETDWILSNYPDRVRAVAAVALNTSPEKTLSLLLDAFAAGKEEKSSQGWSDRSEHLMPEIHKWILGAKPNDDEASERRGLLATSLEKWFTTNKDLAIGVRAAELVLSIKYEATSNPPGEPMQVTFHFGTIAQNQLSKIAALWPRVLPILRQAHPEYGGEIADLFHQWVHPNRPGKGMPSDYEQESREFARDMMIELLAAYAGKWTFHHHLYGYAEKLGLLSRIKIDPTAGVLYPPHHFSDWGKEEARRSASADALASQLKDKEPGAVAETLASIEAQARAARICDTYWGGDVCLRIADATKEPAAWIKPLRENGAPAHLLAPFFRKAAEKQSLDAEIGILLFSGKPDWQALGISLALRHGVPGNPIWQQASPFLKDYTHVIDGLVIRREIGSENLKALLNHEHPKVSGAVAANLWGIRDDATIPDALFEDWKRVIIRHVDKSEEHILERIFPKHPDIAFEWIAWRLDGIRSGAQFYFGSRYDRALPAAIRVLTKDERRRLIDKMPPKSAIAEMVRSLVGRDADLFLHLLSREELEDVRLAPLQLHTDSGPLAENVVQEFDDSWRTLAIAAMDNGFSEKDIASASDAGGFSWTGSRSSMFAARAARFEKLLKHTDPRLRKVGKIGFDHYSKLKDEQLVHEKRAAIRGELA
jgi:hypothetical protein